MPETRGGKNKRKRFKWQCNPAMEQVTITIETGKEHMFSVREIQAILQSLRDRFADQFFPLANNVQKLHDGSERPGLGMAILAQQPGNTYHAQGSSYLGVVLEDCRYLVWNGVHRGIEWRLVDEALSVQTLVDRLRSKSQGG